MSKEKCFGVPLTEKKWAMLQAYNPGDSIGSARSAWDCVLFMEWKDKYLNYPFVPYSCQTLMLEVKAPLYEVREMHSFKDKVWRNK